MPPKLLLLPFLFLLAFNKAGAQSYSRAEIDSLQTYQDKLLKTQGKYSEAEILGKKLITASEEIEFKKGIAQGYLNLGNLYCTLNRFGESIQTLKKVAFFLNEHLDELYLNSRLEIELGRNYMGLGYFNLADKHFRSAMSLTYKLKDKTLKKRLQLFLYGNMADVLNRLNRHTEALNYLEKGFLLNRNAEYAIQISHHYLRYQPTLDSATFYLQFAQRMINAGSDSSSNTRFSLYNDYTLWHKLRKNFNEALKSNKHALKIAQETKRMDLLRDCYHLQSDIYASLGDLGNVNKYLLLYVKLNDSLHMARMPENQIVIDDIQTDLVLKTQQEKNYILIFYSIFGCVTLIPAVWLIYFSHKKANINLSKVMHLKALNTEIVDQNHLFQQAISKLENKDKIHNITLKEVMHDLRAPIGGIVSLLRFLISENKLNGDERELLLLMEKSGLDSLNFVDSLLLQSNVNKDNKKGSVELSNLIMSCIKILHYQAENKNISISFNPHLVNINANKEGITRVINNILTNAIKFSTKNTAIKVKVEEKEHFVIVSIKDNGIGIPDSLKEILYTSSGQRTGTNGEISHGMGLKISKQLVEDHGGEFWFESIEFKGTTFFVKLPKI